MKILFQIFTLTIVLTLSCSNPEQESVSKNKYFVLGELSNEFGFSLTIWKFFSIHENSNDLFNKQFESDTIKSRIVITVISSGGDSCIKILEGNDNSSFNANTCIDMNINPKEIYDIKIAIGKNIFEQAVKIPDSISIESLRISEFDGFYDYLFYPNRIPDSYLKDSILFKSFWQISEIQNRHFDNSFVLSSKSLNVSGISYIKTRPKQYQNYFLQLDKDKQLVILQDFFSNGGQIRINALPISDYKKVKALNDFIVSEKNPFQIKNNLLLPESQPINGYIIGYYQILIDSL